MSKIPEIQAREYIGLSLLSLGVIAFLATKDILYMVIPILLDILLLHLGNYVRYNHAWSSSQIPQITTLQINMTNLTNQVDEIKQTIKQTMNQSNERIKKIEIWKQQLNEIIDQKIQISIQKLLVSTEEIPQQSLVGVTGTVQIALPLAGVVDLESFKAKLQKELGKLEKEIQGFEKRLNNPGFVNKAPQDLIENTKGLLSEAQKQAEIISDRLQRL